MSEVEHKIEYTTISMPKTLVEKKKERMKSTGFSSVSSYVTYVLRQVISSIEAKKNQSKSVQKKRSNNA